MPKHKSNGKKPEEMKEPENSTFSINDYLSELQPEETIHLLQYLLKKNDNNYKLVLEWYKKAKKMSRDVKAKQDLPVINSELLWEYWKRARNIINEFNEYGGP
jgi:hypothetical protein